jgi:hypothetical protein
MTPPDTEGFFYDYSITRPPYRIGPLYVKKIFWKNLFTFR